MTKALGALLFSILFSPGFTLAASVTGQLKSVTDNYPTHLGRPTQDLIPYVGLELQQKYRLRKSLRTQWKLTGLVNTSTRYTPENFYGDVPEAFVEYKDSDSKWRVGMNTVNWGVVDISSPSDSVNTLAMFHPLRASKQGAPMVQAIFGEEVFNVDVIYIPVQRPPQLPAQDSRWLPRKFLIDISDSQLGTLVVPQFLTYEYGHPVNMNSALNNNAGIKLASHLGNWDLQLTHFEGVAPTPKIRPLIEVDSVGGQFVLRSPTTLTPIYYRVRTTGFGLVWAQENWILRGESAYQHTISQDAFIQPWMWSNVLALETNVALGPTTLTLLGQFYYSQNPQSSDNLISSSYRIFDRTAVLGARWTYSEDLTFTVSSLYETITRGLYWSVAFENKLSDQTRWGLSWRDFSAEKDGLIKTFERNDHATMDLIYYF